MKILRLKVDGFCQVNLPGPDIVIEGASKQEKYTCCPSLNAEKYTCCPSLNAEKYASNAYTDVDHYVFPTSPDLSDLI